MGIFSRFFQRGQDGNPVDPSAGGEDGYKTDPDLEVAPVAHSEPHPAPPAAPPQEPAPVRGSSLLGAASGLTPAFVTPASSVVAHPAELQRSIWDSPGPQPRQRTSAPPPSPPPEPSHPVAAESRPPAR